jgi:hypothetical protein
VFADQRVAYDEVVSLLATVDYPTLEKAVARWKQRHNKVVQKYILLYLIERLHSTKEIKLDNYADLTVESRLISGKMVSHGHGEMIQQDIFIESGRSAWAIEKLLEIELPAFREGMTKDEEAWAIRTSLMQLLRVMQLP